MRHKWKYLVCHDQTRSNEMNTKSLAPCPCLSHRTEVSIFLFRVGSSVQKPRMMPVFLRQFHSAFPLLLSQWIVDSLIGNLSDFLASTGLPYLISFAPHSSWQSGSGMRAVQRNSKHNRLLSSSALSTARAIPTCLGKHWDRAPILCQTTCNDFFRSQGAILHSYWLCHICTLD